MLVPHLLIKERGLRPSVKGKGVRGIREASPLFEGASPLQQKKGGRDFTPDPLGRY